MILIFFFFFLLVNHSWSQEGLSMSCLTLILFSMEDNHHILHQATCKVGCQSGDCRWPLNLPYKVCVGMYGLTECR